MIKLLLSPVTAILLLFYIKDTRIVSDKLENQRLPRLFSFLDVNYHEYRKFGLNGPLNYQAKILLDADVCISGSKLVNAILIMYDREQEVSGNPVPKSKIYWMRLRWLALERL